MIITKLVPPPSIKVLFFVFFLQFSNRADPLYRLAGALVDIAVDSVLKFSSSVAEAVVPVRAVRNILINEIIFEFSSTFNLFLKNL